MKSSPPMGIKAVDVWDVLQSLVATDQSMGRILKVPVLNLNHITGCTPDAGTMPGGATGFDGYHSLNINVGAVNQWCGQLYDRLVKVFGYRIRWGPNPNPTAGLFNLEYQDPSVAGASLIICAPAIVPEDGTRSDFVPFPGGPVLAVEWVFECITYDADADLFQEVELIGMVVE